MLSLIHIYLAFVGNLEDVVAEHLTCSTHSIFHGDRIFFDHEINLRLFSKFVQGRSQTAARRVAEATRVRRGCDHLLDKVIEWSRIRLQVGGEAKLFATTHDRDAVVAQRASYQDLVARFAVRTGKIDALRNERCV